MSSRFFCLLCRACLGKVGVIDMNIKNIFLVTLSCICLFSLSSFAQSSRSSSSSRDDNKEEVEPNAGVSFVACSSGGAKIPSRVYVQSAKNGFTQFALPSRKTSMRVPFASDGVYKFWFDDPTAFSSSDEKSSRKRSEIPPADLTVTLASGMSGRVICLLQAKDADEGKLQAIGTCLPVQALPQAGQCILNLSPYSIVLSTSVSGDYSDQQQIKIAPCANMKNVDSSNICVFPGENGQRVNYIISSILPDYNGLSRERASALVISQTKTHIFVVIKDAEKAGVAIEAVQIGTDSKKSSRSRNSKR